jgi:hypothetical protein
VKKAMIVAILGWFLVFACSAPLIAQETTPQPDEGATRAREHREGPLETRTVVLEHISNQTAITAVRAIYQLRQVTEVRAQHMVVFRDHPDVVDGAAKLLKEIDVPPPRWTADVLLVTGSQERLVRRLDIEREEIHLRYSNGADSGVSVDLDAYDPGVATLRTRYSLGASLKTGEGQPAVVLDESGKATFEDGDEFIVVEATRPEIREKLAEAVGHEGQANALVLRFRKR